MNLQLRLKDDSIDSFKKLKKETGMDDAELVSHALSLLKICLEECNRGRRICVVDEDCDVIKELDLNIGNTQNG